MFIDKIKLVLLSVISGILVGLGAIILHSLFNIIWTDILQVASPSWRSQLVIVSGLVSSIGWYFLQRKGKELVSVEKQIFPKTSREQFPDFGRHMGHILLFVILNHHYTYILLSKVFFSFFPNASVLIFYL